MAAVVRRIAGFIADHKKKLIALLSLAGLGVLGYYYAKKAIKDSLKQVGEQAKLMKQRARKESELVRLRGECTATVLTFLHPLKKQLNKLTDPRPVTVQLKELRARQKAKALNKEPPSKEDEAMADKLWEDLKVLSLSRLVASVYALTLLDVLLRVQLHVAAKAGFEQRVAVTQKVREQFMFKATDFFVNQGLQTLLTRVQDGVRLATKPWLMGTEATVTRKEIVEMMKLVRRSIEEGRTERAGVSTVNNAADVAGGGMIPALDSGGKTDLSQGAHAWFLSCLIQPDDALSRAKQDAGLSDEQAEGLKEMLMETMDLLESPHCAAVLEDSLSRLFTLLLDDLYAHQYEAKQSAEAPPQSSATTSESIAARDEVAASEQQKEKKFILAKVIVGMKLVAGEVLSSSEGGGGEEGDEQQQQQQQQQKAPEGSSVLQFSGGPMSAAAMAPGTDGAPLVQTHENNNNKYMREIENLASLETLTRAILGVEKGGEGDDPLGGLAGIGDEEMRAITNILQSIGGAGGAGGGAPGGMPDMAQLLQQLAGGAGNPPGGMPPGLLGMMPSGMPAPPTR